MTAKAQLRIYDYFLKPPIDPQDWFEIPIGINYNNDLTIEPKLKQNIVKGEIIKDELYAPNNSNGEYDLLLTYVNHSYKRDNDDYYLLEQTIEQFYLDENGDLKPVPTKKRFFDLLDVQIEEVQRRRKFILDRNVIAAGKKFGLDREISDYYAQYSDEITLYKQIGSPVLYNATKSADPARFPWLDRTIATITPRQLMLNLFDIAINPVERGNLT